MVRLPFTNTNNMRPDVPAIANLSSLQEDLKQLLKQPIDKKVFVGFDGFVDKIKKAVKERQNSKAIYFPTIRDFAARIARASGKSGQIQMDTQLIKLGGNAPILSNTLGKLGVKSYCVGSMGYPKKHSIFQGMNRNSELISVIDPGLSDAVEFSDGKIIFSELEVFDRYTWTYVKDTTGIDRLLKIASETSLFAFVDWANLPHATDIWDGFLHDVIRHAGRRDFYFFFDLCDPSKRTVQQIDEVLDVIGSFSSYGTVTLGLNENETLKIWAALNGFYLTNDVTVPPFIEAGDFLYKFMSIDSLLVHPVDRCVLYRQREIIELKGRLVTTPKVLTGGGDNLNAGFCMGILAGMSLPECMLLGIAASGSYIENGISPDIPELVRYLDVWKKELLAQGQVIS